MPTRPTAWAVASSRAFAPCWRWSARGRPSPGGKVRPPSACRQPCCWPRPTDAPSCWRTTNAGHLPSPFRGSRPHRWWGGAREGGYCRTKVPWAAAHGLGGSGRHCGFWRWPCHGRLACHGRRQRPLRRTLASPHVAGWACAKWARGGRVFLLAPCWFLPGRACAAPLFAWPGPTAAAAARAPAGGRAALPRRARGVVPRVARAWTRRPARGNPSAAGRGALPGVASPSLPSGCAGGLSACRGRAATSWPT